MYNFNRASKQSGASMWGLIGGSALVILFAMITMKLVPAYLDNNKVASALDSLAKTPGAAQMSRRQVLDKIDNTLYIDMAHDLLDLKEALTITKTKNTKVFSIDYERVIPMAYNISALLDFENSVEVSLK
ncbi:MAG: DUF4845 domain-containing protein [Arenicellales bacterium]|jgi:hypothetical protein